MNIQEMCLQYGNFEGDMSRMSHNLWCFLAEVESLRWWRGTSDFDRLETLKLLFLTILPSKHLK